MIATFTVSADRPAIQNLLSRHDNSLRNLFGEIGQLWGPNLSMFPDRPAYVYLHGDLMDRLDYDIPVFLEGTVLLRNVQDAQVIDPYKNETLACKLFLFKRDYVFPNSLYGLIVLPQDEDDVLHPDHMKNNQLTPLF